MKLTEFSGENPSEIIAKLEGWLKIVKRQLCLLNHWHSKHKKLQINLNLLSKCSMLLKKVKTFRNSNLSTSEQVCAHCDFAVW